MQKQDKTTNKEEKSSKRKTRTRRAFKKYREKKKRLSPNEGERKLDDKTEGQPQK